MLRIKYAMNYHSKNSFSMSYASHEVIFPGVLLLLQNTPFPQYVIGIDYIQISAIQEMAQ